MPSQKSDLIEWGRTVLQIEKDALERAIPKLGQSFSQAVERLERCLGRVVLTGIGKSGHVAQKIASTLSSTGTSSFYLHPSEALHGDFGMITAKDAMIALSYGGETREILAVVGFAKSLGLPVLSITGNLESSLAQLSDFVLDGSVVREADSLGLAPTASSTLSLALGDALAVALMRKKTFTKGAFLELHPGGSLGRASTCVDELMHKREELKCVHGGVFFYEVMGAMTSPNFGIIAVVDESDRLLGAVTDGDLRRVMIKKKENSFALKAFDFMNSSPKRLSPNMRALDAVSLMNRHKITSIFVCDDDCKLLGLIRLHDLMTANIL